MILHIRYIGSKSFQEEDKELLKELQNINVELSWDYEYITNIPESKRIECEKILRKYNRAFFFS